MLQVARLAPNLLREAAPLVEQFVRSRLNPDGGFADRAGRSDLYYTVFGLECLIALRAEPPLEQVTTYLRTFGDGQGLDFIHLGCLARCWAAAGRQSLDDATRRRMLERIAAFRSADGGFDDSPGSDTGTAYGCFVGLASYEDLGAELLDEPRLAACLASLATSDGGYTNQQGLNVGMVPATAAAITVLHHLRRPIDPRAAQWLLNCCHPDGGFFAMPGAPMPDLLSTAVALHALTAMHADISAVREPCLDYIDTLWTSRGGFYGNWAEEPDDLDCEYTWYGLLALGHLSL